MLPPHCLKEPVYAVLGPLLGSLLISVPSLAAVHPGGSALVPPDSFINTHVASVHALSQEVTLDPAVRGRLARHFHVTDAQITTYVRRSLVLTHLSKAGSYRVACVRRDGREYWITARLPAGTPLFASRTTGRPVLKAACGNPMVSDLPTMSSTLESLKPVPPAEASPAPLPAAAPATVAAGLVPGAVPVTDLIADDAVAPVIVRVSPSLETLLVPAAGGVGHAFNFLGPVLATGLALAVGSSGGTSPSNGAVPVPAVPEASTTVSLGLLMLLGLGSVIVAKKRKQQSA